MGKRGEEKGLLSGKAHSKAFSERRLTREGEGDEGT